jgi:multimeric flavodoxin WrbA
MSNKRTNIKVLGISGSPRSGNSSFLLSIALQAAQKVNNELVSIDSYSFKGKKFGPCVACFKCGEEKTYGECTIKDDFQKLRDKWLEADAIIYAVPVYHLSIPGQMKCFIDRLGNTVKKIRGVSAPKFMKTVGAIAQGMHFFAGQELTISFILHHAVLMNCIPVSGDGWQSYLGAAGWTEAQRDRDSIGKLYGASDRDANIAVQAAGSLGQRVTEMAFIIRQGIANVDKTFFPDKSYTPVLEI